MDGDRERRRQHPAGVSGRDASQQAVKKVIGKHPTSSRMGRPGGAGGANIVLDFSKGDDGIMHQKVNYVLRNQRNYFRVLEIKPSADAAAIKRQYQSIASVIEPYRTTHAKAAEAYTVLSSAYSTLVNPVVRSLYVEMLKKQVGQKLDPMPQQNPVPRVQAMQKKGSEVAPATRFYHLPNGVRGLLRVPFLGPFAAVTILIVMLPAILLLSLLVGLWWLAWCPAWVFCRVPKAKLTNSKLETVEPLGEQIMSISVESVGEGVKGEKIRKVPDLSLKALEQLVKDSTVPVGKPALPLLEPSELFLPEKMAGGMRRNSDPKPLTAGSTYNYGMFSPNLSSAETKVLAEAHQKPFLFFTYSGTNKVAHPAGASLFRTYGGQQGSGSDLFETHDRNKAALYRTYHPTDTSKSRLHMTDVVDFDGISAAFNAMHSNNGSAYKSYINTHQKIKTVPPLPKPLDEESVMVWLRRKALMDEPSGSGSSTALPRKPATAASFDTLYKHRA